MVEFDEAWAASIPDASWPTALARACAEDPAVLATKRAVRSLRQWQRAARAGSIEDRAHLERVMRALIPPRPSPPSERTVVIQDAAILETRDLEVLALAEDRHTLDLGSTSDASTPTPSTVGQPPPRLSTDARKRIELAAEVLKPLAEELLPLPPARRARRFWVRWREVAGQQGVRRDEIESRLVSAVELKELHATLVSEKIGLSLDQVRSVLDPS